MTTAPWLSLGFHAATLPTLKVVHVAKRAKCNKCPGKVFFTQGKDSAKCRQCGSELPLKSYTVLRSEVLIGKEDAETGPRK